MIKRVPATFTLDELLAHLRDDEQAPDGYWTAQEWADHFGLSAGTMRKLIREADERGVLKRSLAPRQRIDLRFVRQTVYKFDGFDFMHAADQDDA